MTTNTSFQAIMMVLQFQHQRIVFLIVHYYFHIFIMFSIQTADGRAALGRQIKRIRAQSTDRRDFLLLELRPFQTKYRRGFWFCLLSYTVYFIIVLISYNQLLCCILYIAHVIRASGLQHKVSDTRNEDVFLLLTKHLKNCSVVQC